MFLLTWDKLRHGCEECGVVVVPCEEILVSHGESVAGPILRDWLKSCVHCTATGSTLGQHTRAAGHLQGTAHTEQAHTELKNTTSERKINFWWVTDLCCVTTAGGAVCRVGDTAKICCQARHVRCVPSGVLCQHFQITIHTVIQEGRMVSLPGDFTHRLHYN